MRLFFLLLLLANLAFFYWHEPITAWLAERAAPARSASAGSDAPSLVLLSERVAREEESRLAVRDGVPPEISGAGGNATPPASSPPLPSKSAAEPALELARESVRAPKPQPPLAAGVCLEVGPWEDAGRAREAADAAKRAGMKAAIETAERDMPGGSYWLVTQQRFDQPGARDMKHRMNEDGIEDIAIVSLDGAWAISLGLYSRPATAERRRRQMLDLGYTPELRRQTEKRSVHLLRLDSAGAGADAIGGLLGALQQAEPQLEWRESACP